jgi:2-polyprenyl-6-methoxyphenol hydroxylase-like FAD-dependent oxidoreductase
MIELIMGFERDSFGCSYILLERRQFLQILYDTLPDKTRIRTDCGIKDVKHVAGGVEVTLSNGEVEVGDMVLGCDGTYSAVRSKMWDYANKMTPGLITTKEKTCEFVPCSYQVLVAGINLSGLANEYSAYVSLQNRLEGHSGSHSPDARGPRQT